jgi:hypothetical protein
VVMQPRVIGRRPVVSAGLGLQIFNPEPARSVRPQSLQVTLHRKDPRIWRGNRNIPVLLPSVTE